MARMVVCGHVGLPVEPLPFFVILVVDASGSLTPQDVPNVYTAIDAIKTDLISIGFFSSQAQADRYILDRNFLANERYLRWYEDLPSRLAPAELPPENRKCVIINFQDESCPVYHVVQKFGISGRNSGKRYNGDLSAFQASLSSDSGELIAARLYAVPSNNVFPSFIAHLEHVFGDPSGGNYPTPSLSSFVNLFGRQMLDYTVTENRNSPGFTVDYLYNLMAAFLNIHLGDFGFATLTLR